MADKTNVQQMLDIIDQLIGVLLKHKHLYVQYPSGLAPSPLDPNQMSQFARLKIRLKKLKARVKTKFI